MPGTSELEELIYMAIRMHDINRKTPAPAFLAGGRLVVPRALAS